MNNKNINEVKFEISTSYVIGDIGEIKNVSIDTECRDKEIGNLKKIFLDWQTEMVNELKKRLRVH